MHFPITPQIFYRLTDSPALLFSTSICPHPSTPNTAPVPPASAQAENIGLSPLAKGSSVCHCKVNSLEGKKH